ncbi:MAG: type II toxin-antitoxin system ParD family antitoxin [Parvibaculum sp.]|uniref:type II toxin-antitoxin system ParD family antitoxin n=1 Tax=Parvibaculum sp. TaxID=2024848 RepID=UPI002731E05E|nr:type II toxin-antitoxin system ParD family antitoxin [Parvibaculum sp.]MDP2151364.1 type II toxin-antitoxin system ParD family antitoxin [Parvibaculum sp.]
MATNVHLTPELERFARQCVEEGRYNNVSEVVRSALRMLQDAEDRKKAFMAMLDAVREESDRDGWVSADDAIAQLDAVIDAAEARLGPDQR